MWGCESVRELEGVNGVTWDELTKREPELKTLLGRARQAGAACRGWEDVDRVFGPLRYLLSDLVGFLSKNRRCAVLGSTRAFEVAYWKLYDAVTRQIPPQGAAASPSGTV
jgi:hypothetical protein